MKTMATYAISGALYGTNYVGTAYDDRFIIKSDLGHEYLTSYYIDGSAGFDVITIQDYLSNWYGNIKPNQTSTIQTEITVPAEWFGETTNVFTFTLRGIEMLEFIDYNVEVDDPPSNTTPEPEESIVGGLILNIESAEHLYRVNGRSKTIKYYADKKGKMGEPIGLANPTKMSKKEYKYIKKELKKLSDYTELNFIETKNWDESAFDIFKVSSFRGDPDLLGYMSSTDYGNYMVFRNDTDANEEKQTITHEIGHGVGLSHPYQEPSNPKYNTVDTVMSYNSAKNSNGTTWVGSFRPDDITAASYIWGEGLEDLNNYKPKAGNKAILTQANDERLIDDFDPPEFVISGKNEQMNFNKYWKKNLGKIFAAFEENLAGQYTGVKFEAGGKRLNFDMSKFSGIAPGNADFHGFIEIIGNERDNTFIARGSKLFTDENGERLFASDLVIDGGDGEDTVVVPNGFDFDSLSTFTGFGRRGREIYFAGEMQQVVKTSGKIIEADYEQGLTILETVEYISINDKIFTFSDLYDSINSGNL